MRNAALRCVLAAAAVVALAACGETVEETTGVGGGSASGGAGASGAAGGAGGGGATGGAGGAGAGGSGGEGAAGGAGGGGGAAPCATGGSTNLQGVTITFPEQACSFTLAQAKAGVEIAYEVVVADDVIGVLPEPQDAGGCDGPGPSGLILFESLAGGGQSYCICDSGLCPGPSDVPVTLAKGTYPGTFSWDGVNWQGPSDTGNPKGPPFPPGSYVLTVSAVGKADAPGGFTPFAVTGTFDIHVTP